MQYQPSESYQYGEITDENWQMGGSGRKNYTREIEESEIVEETIRQIKKTKRNETFVS